MDYTGNPELFKLFLENTPTAVAMFDRDMRYLFASHQWLIDYELGDIDLTGRSHYEVFPNIPEKHKACYNLTLETGQASTLEDHFLKPSQSLERMKWEVHPWYANSDEIGGLIVSTQILPKLRPIDSAEEKIENQFYNLGSNLPGMIYQLQLRTNGELAFSYVSSGCSSLCELEPEALVESYSLFVALLHPDDRQQYEIDFRTSAETLNSWRWEGRIITPSGKIKWLSGTSRPERQINGNIVWDGLLVDITERKQAEIALREQEAELRALFAAMTDVIQVLDRHGRHLKIAPTNSTLLAKPGVELLGLTLHDVLPADTANRLLSAVRRAIDSKQTVDVEYCLPIADSEIWFAAKISPLQANVREQTLSSDISLSTMGHGAIATDEDTAICVARDITQRKIAEAELQQYKEELEERVKDRTAQLAAEITERQQIERSLRQHVQMLDLANDTIMILNLSRELTYWNHGAHKLYGWTTKQAIGQRAHTLLKTEFPQPLEEIEAELLDRGHWEGELIHTKQDGTKVIVASRWTLQRDDTGEVAAVLEINNDITLRKHAEAELRKSEELYRTLAQNFPDGAVVLFDNELRFTLAEGREMSKLVKVKQRLEGRTLDAIFPEDVRAIVEPHYRTALLGVGGVAEVTIGDRFYLVQTLPVQNDGGEIIAGMSLVQNITQRKRQEDALRQSEARHRELAQRKELINRLASQVRNSLDIDTILQIAVTEIRNLLEIDRCMFVWYRSDGMEPAWEVVKEAKLPQLPSLLGRFPFEQQGPLAIKLLNLETLRVDDLIATSDPALRQLHTQVGYTSTLTLPIQTSKGEIGAVSCGHFSGPRPWRDSEVELLQSVTDQLAIAISQAELYAQATEAAEVADRRAQELEETLRQLQRTQSQLIQSEKMSSLGQLVAGVAHEINNPVNFIYANLAHAREYTSSLIKVIELYSQTYPDPPSEIEEKIDEIDLEYLIGDLPKLLDSMKVGAERISIIVEALKNFSRHDQAAVKDVDIHHGLDSTLMILQNRFKAHGNRPEIEIIKEYGQLPKINCYAGHLNQVFMNLLTNSLDALDECFEKKKMSLPNPHIRLSTRVIDNRAVEIRIADNGPGMTEEVKKNLFDPFFTTKPVGKGTGLGLAVSYQIVVEKHGGSIDCISQPGKGAVFAISIPIKKSSQKVLNPQISDSQGVD